MKKTKIKSKFSIILVIFIVGIIFIINNSYSKVEIKYKSEFASQGDTLWEIAERECKNNKYYQDKDIRYIIYDLKQINNFSSSSLIEGQEIKIPNYN